MNRIHSLRLSTLFSDWESKDIPSHSECVFLCALSLCLNLLTHALSLIHMYVSYRVRVLVRFLWLYYKLAAIYLRLCKNNYNCWNKVPFIIWVDCSYLLLLLLQHHVTYTKYDYTQITYTQIHKIHDYFLRFVCSSHIQSFVRSFVSHDYKLLYLATSSIFHTIFGTLPG